MVRRLQAGRGQKGLLGAEMTGHEFVTDTGAGAALTSPFWLPALHDVSDVAALLLPILGAAWLVLQIALKVYSVRKERASTLRRRR